MKDEDFIILGFPCNQFGGQEPGGVAEIKACTTEYGVTFPIMEKIDVKGPNAHPLFSWLQAQKSSWMGSGIKWNFSKFLIDKEGQCIDRFAPTTGISSVAKAVSKLL